MEFNKEWHECMRVSMTARGNNQLYISNSRAAKVGGDLKGDYYQVGGTLVVKKGGEKVLLSHKQQELADHVDTKENGKKYFFLVSFLCDNVFSRAVFKNKRIHIYKR
ncbi:hypothetical protein TNCV_4344551 [Trichonephila clavipes]|nr:hypothetical protein TNCV_4344551 [Trichonephila clavipes]